MPKGKTGLRVIERKGRASLYLRGTVRGIYVFESLGTDDPRLAEEARAQREAEIYRRAVHGGPQPVTFAAAVLSYGQTQKPGRDTQATMKRLLNHFGPTVLCTQIDQGRIDAAGRALCRSTAKPATIQRTVTTPIAAVLNHAARRGWCDPPRFERAKPSGARTEWLTPLEAEALIAESAEHLKPLVTFLLCTGARLSEALELTWENIMLAYGRLTFPRTKNGHARIVELVPRAVAALAGLPGDREGAVFRHHGEAYRRDADSKAHYGGQIKSGWATAVRKAKIRRHVTPHITRHTFATWHYAAHKDLMRLRDAGGWRSISMVERYAKLAPDQIGIEAMIFWGIGAKSAPAVIDGRLTA